ncbi:uncharacterized protein LOC143029140 [Oratosquilla oratoria]|uniref:uncharacterized protein LOC143029140 n=1 Tax=Oratosquilla oratoria TaxID=337810 RepID=UPI003F762928
MEEEGRVVHHKILQNANQLMEICVKTIPKKKGLFSKPEKNNNFVRDCLLKKEIEVLQGNLERKTRTENESHSKRGRGGVTVKSSKVSRSRRSSGDSKKKDKVKKHPVLPPNTSWGEFLESQGTISSVSEQDIVLISSHADGMSSSQSNSSDSRISRNSDKRTGEGQSSGSSRNRDFRKEAKKNVSSGIISRDVDDRSVQTSAWLNRESSRYTSSKIHTYRTCATQTNAHVTQEHSKRSGVDRIVETPQIAEDYQDQKRNATPSTDHMQERQRTGYTSQSKELSEGQRLISDDINATPFGESALLLLRRLRERLNAQGDSEGCEILGILSTHFSSNGTNNRLNGLSAYSSVFPTPDSQLSKEHKLCLQLQQELANERKVRKLQEHKIQEMEKLCAKFISYYEKMISKEEEKRDSQHTNSAPPPEKIAQPQAVNQSGEEQEEVPGVINNEAEGNKGRELKYKLWKMQAERDALEKELRIQHTLTSNLHVQLTRAYKELEQTRSLMSGSVQIMESSTHENDPQNHHRHSRSGSCVSSKESEVDSAYDERVSSRLTLKHSSPKTNLPTLLERTALGTDNIISNSTKSTDQGIGQSTKNTDQSMGNCLSHSTITREHSLGTHVAPTVRTTAGTTTATSVHTNYITNSGPLTMNTTAISPQATHITNAVMPQTSHLTAELQRSRTITAVIPQTANPTTTTARINAPPGGLLAQTSYTNNDWMRGCSPVVLDSRGLGCGGTLPEALLNASTIPYDIAHVPQFSHDTLATQNPRSNLSIGNTRQQEVDFRMSREPGYAATTSRVRSGIGNLTSTDQEGQSSNEMYHTDRRHHSKVKKDGRRQQFRGKKASHKESQNESADDMSEGVPLVGDFVAEFSDVDSNPRTLIEKEEFSQISNFSPAMEPLITADSILSDLNPLKNTEKQDLSFVPSKLDCASQKDANTSVPSEPANHPVTSLPQGKGHKLSQIDELNQEFLPSQVEAPGSDVCVLDLTRTSDTPSSIMFPPHESTRIQAAPYLYSLKAKDLTEQKKGNTDGVITSMEQRKINTSDSVIKPLDTVDENTEKSKVLLQPCYLSSSGTHMDD